MSSDRSLSGAIEQARRDLRDYVSAWMRHDATPDVDVLARLVNDAPAKHTLNDYEWWNVALLLAMELKHRG